MFIKKYSIRNRKISRNKLFYQKMWDEYSFTYFGEKNQSLENKLENFLTGSNYDFAEIKKLFCDDFTEIKKCIRIDNNKGEKLSLNNYPQKSLYYYKPEKFISCGLFDVVLCGNNHVLKIISEISSQKYIINEIMKIKHLKLNLINELVFEKDTIVGYSMNLYYEIRNWNFEVFFSIVNFIEYIHSMDVVHCDLKPSNIMVDKNNVLKIIDFESSSFEDEVGNGRYTNPYCPEESLDPNYIVKKNFDIYSLGIIIKEKNDELNILHEELINKRPDIKCVKELFLNLVFVDVKS